MFRFGYNSYCSYTIIAKYMYILFLGMSCSLKLEEIVLSGNSHVQKLVQLASIALQN